jgi:hypothetical protein
MMIIPFLGMQLRFYPLFFDFVILPLYFENDDVVCPFLLRSPLVEIRISDYLQSERRV